MTTSNPIPQSLDPGTARKREDAAKARRAKYQASPEVRSQLAAILEERDALRERQTADDAAKRQGNADVFRIILGRATADELAELARSITRLDGRRLEAIVQEEFRAKTRTASSPALETPAEAPSAPEASSGRRTRRSPS